MSKPSTRSTRPSSTRGLSTRELGRILRPYGIRAKTIRLASGTAKGYTRGQFNDAFARYAET